MVVLAHMTIRPIKPTWLTHMRRQAQGCERLTYASKTSLDSLAQIKSKTTIIVAKERARSGLIPRTITSLPHQTCQHLKIITFSRAILAKAWTLRSFWQIHLEMVSSKPPLRSWNPLKATHLKMTRLRMVGRMLIKKIQRDRKLESPAWKLDQLINASVTPSSSKM